MMKDDEAAASDEEEFEGLIASDHGSRDPYEVDDDVEENQDNGLEMTQRSGTKTSSQIGKEGDNNSNGNNDTFGNIMFQIISIFMILDEKLGPRGRWICALATALLLIALSPQILALFSWSSPEHLHRLIQRHQIQNYQKGTALIINVHVTHHGGETVANSLGRAPNTLGCPSLDCNEPRPPEDHVVESQYPYEHPWSFKETGRNIQIVRQYFHFIGWQFKGPPKGTISLADTDWDNENLVSIYVTRDPITRMLADDPRVKQAYPFVYKGSLETQDQGTQEQWMQFANDNAFSDNYALRILAGKDCCNGAQTDARHLETAKDLLRSFTFIIDIACLNESLHAVAKALGIQLAQSGPDQKRTKHSHVPGSYKNVPYPNVLEYMLERNRLSLELHEWAQQNAIVQCPKDNLDDATLVVRGGDDQGNP